MMRYATLIVSSKDYLLHCNFYYYYDDYVPSTRHGRSLSNGPELSKLSRSTSFYELLASSKALRDHQTVNLLKRCQIGSSAAAQNVTISYNRPSTT